jgi:hypothetical protein
MLSPPTVYEQPDRDPGRQFFKSGYFTIRGECDLRPAFNAQIGAGGGHFSYWGGEAHSIVDGNFPYKGALKIVSVPKGSTWQVSVSDIPNDRAPAPVEHNFSGSNYVPRAAPCAQASQRQGRCAGAPDAAAAVEQFAPGRHQQTGLIQREALLGMPLGLAGKTAGSRRNPCWYSGSTSLSLISLTCRMKSSRAWRAR